MGFRKRGVEQIVFIPHSKPTIDQDDVQAVVEVLRSGKIAQGEKVREFEEAFSRFVGAKYAVACSSGTSALHLALLSLRMSTSKEVIMPSYVCTSPYLATLHAGAIPRIVDISVEDFNICADTARKELSSRTGAIIVPHMFGMPAELDELLELGVPIVEDCAQSLGAEYRRRKVGTYGDLGIFSFYATKMITSGEGGMVLTDNERLYNRILESRDYDGKPLTPIKYNYKMTDFQAALGLSQLGKLHNFIKLRKRTASFYSKAFSECPIRMPSLFSHRQSVFYRYVVTSDRIELLRNKLKERGVACERPVFKPLHMNISNCMCPNTDEAYNHALSIPIYPSLSQVETEFVISEVKAAYPIS